MRGVKSGSCRRVTLTCSDGFAVEAPQTRLCRLALRLGPARRRSGFALDSFDFRGAARRFPATERRGHGPDSLGNPSSHEGSGVRSHPPTTFVRHDERGAGQEMRW